MNLSGVVSLLTIILPWPIRRLVLSWCFGYRLHPTSRIGLSWVFPKELVMEEHSRIGHLTVCKGLALVHLKANAMIGNLNWVTGFPQGDSRFFQHRLDRRAALMLDEHAAITHRHLFDCTDLVTVGKFATVAGYHSKVLTHTIDLRANKQTCEPVSIGSYCFVGTNCVLLSGSALPDNSVLAAGAVLTKSHSGSFQLYAGVPARPVKELSADLAYFNREAGLVS
jgi:serine acetyltransferase